MRRSRLAKILSLALLACTALVIGCGSDTAKLTFVSEVEGDAEIYVIDPDSGISTPLADNRSSDRSPI